MNNCEKYIGLISELMDGEISDADRSELEIHLEFCPECRKVAEAFAAISDGFPKEEKVPENFTEGTMAKIKAEAAKPVGIKKFISGYGKYTGLAAALVVILLGAQVFNGGAGDDAAAPMAPMAMVADRVAEAEAAPAAGDFVVKGEDDREFSTVTAGSTNSVADSIEAAPEEEAMPDSAPLSEPAAAPQLGVTVEVTDVNELYARMGYTERFYSVYTLYEPVSDELSVLLESSDSSQIFRSLSEKHYKVPMEQLNKLAPDIFTEIVFDDLTAQYGLVILMTPEE